MRKYLSGKLDALVSEHSAILFIRVAAGALILTHGIPKLTNVLSGQFQFGDPLGLGPAFSLILVAFAEGICGFLVLIGLGTRLASIILVINMAVAGFIAHAGDPFGTKEKALLFLIFFISTSLLGGGKYSLDNKFFGK